MATSTDLATKVAAGGAALDKKGDTVFDLLKRYKPQIEAALPKGMSSDRLLRVVTTEIRRNPGLGECTPLSLIGALMLAAQLGLEPGPLGQAYMVPFSNSKTGQKEITFIIGYKGLIALALRSEKIVSIAGHEVCANDIFEFDYGTEYVKHTYDIRKERGEVVAYYAKATLYNGAQQIRVLTMSDIDKRRKRSKAASSGPWQTDPVAMGVKTAIRTLCSQLPLTSEVERALLADEGSTFAQSNGTTMNVTATVEREDGEDVIEMSEVEEELNEQFQMKMEDSE